MADYYLFLNLVVSRATGGRFDAYLIEFVTEAITRDKARKDFEEG